MSEYGRSICTERNCGKEYYRLLRGDAWFNKVFGTKKALIY